jgi:iron complex outermembrane receptor protein
MTNWGAYRGLRHATAAVFVVLISAVRAEEPPVSDASKPKPPVEAPAVEVTAPRIPEPRRQEPVSARQLNQSTIEHAGIKTTSQIGSYVPNLNTTDTGGRENFIIGMRGLSNAYYFGDPTVGLRVDDIPIADPRAFSFALFDVERIEVLRGPQMTESGKGAEAGQINVTTHRPTNDYHGEVTASYGNYNSVYASASVRGPILKEKLLFTFSAAESRRDGFLDNSDGSHPDHRQDIAGRTQLVYTPLPELEFTATLAADRAHDGTTTYVLLSRPDMFETDNDIHGGSDLFSYLGALKAVYHAPLFTLTSVTSRQSWDVDHNTSDFDFTPDSLVVFFDEYNFTQWSQELRLNSTEKFGRWSWVGGGYFEDRSTDTNLGVQLPDAGLLQAVNIPLAAPVYDRQRSHMYSRTFAGFGQATCAVNDKLNVTFGLRVEHNANNVWHNRILESPTQHAGIVATPGTTASTSSDVALPKLAVDYAVKPNMSIYGTAAEGYRPGGFSHLTSDSKVFHWQRESLWNFEVGMKSAWLRNRVMLDLSLFYDPVKDFQTRHQVGGGQFWIDNAKRATTRGFEAQVQARPIKGVELDAGFGYTDAHYDSFFEPGTGEHFDGNMILLAPRYTFTLAAQYMHSTGFFARVEYNGVGKYPLQENNIQFQEPYQLLNARIGLERKHFGVYLFGKNLTDEQYTGFGVPDVFGKGLVGSPGDPRTFGLMGQYKF